MNRKTIIIASLLIVATVSVACVITGFNDDEKTITETRNPGNFHGIDADSGFDVFLYQDGKNEVILEADSSLIEHIETKVKNGVLQIRLNKSFAKINKLSVHVHFDEINIIKASGGSDVVSKTILKQDKLEINASGGADVDVQVDANTIVAGVSGGADLDISGTSNKLNINASGGSDVKAYKLKSLNALVNASGGCDVEVFATQQLDIDASGASDVVFCGNPSVVNINKSGASDVKRRMND